MNGILVVDKPAGITSHGVVARCRKLLDERKIGHAGTLDPDATGVLILGVGRATRLLQFLEVQDKTYRATFRLGVETSTQDASGSMVAERDASGITEDDVRTAMRELVGQIEQTPPMVSAIKIGGEPLYKKAWRGETIERPSRTVSVYELELESFNPPTLRVRCSKGTYVRTLVHDVGQILRVGAHVTTLRRLASGAFDEQHATALDDISPASVKPMEIAVASYPRRDVDAAEATMLVQGKRIQARGFESTHAIFYDNRLLAMATEQGSETRTMCVLAQASDLVQ